MYKVTVFETVKELLTALEPMPENGYKEGAGLIPPNKLIFNIDSRGYWYLSIKDKALEKQFDVSKINTTDFLNAILKEKGIMLSITVDANTE